MCFFFCVADLAIGATTQQLENHEHVYVFRDTKRPWLPLLHWSYRYWRIYPYRTLHCCPIPTSVVCYSPLWVGQNRPFFFYNKTVLNHDWDHDYSKKTQYAAISRCCTAMYPLPTRITVICSRLFPAMIPVVVEIWHRYCGPSLRRLGWDEATSSSLVLVGSKWVLGTAWRPQGHRGGVLQSPAPGRCGAPWTLPSLGHGAQWGFVQALPRNWWGTTGNAPKIIAFAYNMPMNWI